ncbi:MAG: RNA methyltransferase [Anaerolineales bacterium]|nr:RNA methyltransferase [Anaerolineales bacterium]
MMAPSTEQAWKPLVAQLERVTTRRGRQQTGFFSIEGIRLHERALRAGNAPTQVLLSASLFTTTSERVQQLLAALQAAGSDLIVAPDDVVAALTKGRQLGAMLGLLPLPTSISLAQVVAAVDVPLLLVAADVVDPGNVGALMRTGHASGITAFIAVGVSDSYHPRAVQTSRGSLFKLPLLQYDNLDVLCQDLQALKIGMVGTAVTGGTLLPQTTFTRRGTAVFMGNEYWGLQPDVIASLDTRITIPMAAGVDSYAVNAAAAIVLYEIQRQWGLNQA